jgi:hypothetical protein
MQVEIIIIIVIIKQKIIESLIKIKQKKEKGKNPIAEKLSLPR